MWKVRFRLQPDNGEPPSSAHIPEIGMKVGNSIVTDELGARWQFKEDTTYVLLTEEEYKDLRSYAMARLAGTTDGKAFKKKYPE